MKGGKIGIGIIGFGGIARGAHLTSGYRKLPDQCEVLAAADILESKCDEAGGEFSIPESYSDYKKLCGEHLRPERRPLPGHRRCAGGGQACSMREAHASASASTTGAP